MSVDTTKLSSKVKRLLREIVGRRYTFEASQGDLELLRAIAEGTYADTKPGDPSFHAYAAAVNVANEFATQALDIPELIPFNNQLADVQEEYMPSYPPMSPVTSAFFAGWLVLDARDSFSGLTIGELFAHYLEHTDKLDYLRKAMAALNNSCCSFYEVADVGDANEVKLWDIVGQQEVQCWNSSGYGGRRGEVWYVRVLPPLTAGSGRSVTVSTPYVFWNGDRHTWEAFFGRYLASKGNPGCSLREYLKYGKWLGYWMEFVFQAYANHTGNMILVTGVPDDPSSLPHSHPKHKL
jgi:hypothetical protein